MKTKKKKQSKDKKWKPLPFPKEDCMCLDVDKKDNRIICDAVGDDVSPEFCHYCRYYSKTYGVIPYRFATEFSSFIMDLCDEKKFKKLKEPLPEITIEELNKK